MSEQYITMGTNIVCTNMTKSEPLKIGTPSRVCTALTENSLPVLRIVDCKISACFSCRVPQMKWGGIIVSLVGIAAGALLVAGVIAVVVATVATGGLAGGIIAGIGAAILPAAEVVSASLAIGYATMVGSAIKMGYDCEHLCDASLDAKWELGLPNTIIEGEQAILSRSFIPCPQGGIVTLIVDDNLANQAARMIADSNRNMHEEEMWNQLFQGMIGGAIGAANPVSMVITAAFALKDGFDGYAEDDLNINQYEMLYENKEFEYDYQEKIGEEARNTATEEGVEAARGEGTYSDIKGSWGEYKGSKQNETKAIEKYQRAESKATRREQKISNNSSDKMKGRAKSARQEASHQRNIAKQAAKDTKYAKGKFIGGLIGFGMGIAGSAVNILIDSKFKEEEYNMTRDIVSDLNELHKQDVQKSKIVSGGK